MLPTFLGIGAPKSGSTWLYKMMESHPDLRMPEHMKPLHYFDSYFDKGLFWYERFFPTTHEPGTAVGEFTRTYLYSSDAPKRVRSVASIDRFVLIVRNPVDRAFSHYRFAQRQDNYTGSFDTFAQEEPSCIERGFFGRYLAQWLAEFDPRQFLVLPFETAVRDVEGTRTRLAEHLGVDPRRFPVDAGVTAANEAFVPKHRRVYALAARQARWLRRHDLDVVISLANRSGLSRVLNQATAPTNGAKQTAPALRERLWERYEPDVRLLEELTGLDLDVWRSSST